MPTRQTDKSSLEQFSSLGTHYILMRLGKSLFCFVLFESLFPFFNFANAKLAACKRKEGISFGGSALDWFIEKMTALLTLSPLQLIGSLAGVTRRDTGCISKSDPAPVFSTF